MKSRMTVLTIGVDDLQGSRSFYRDGLGLPTKGTLIVGGKRRVQLLNARRAFAGNMEAGLAHDELVDKRALRRLAPGIDAEADGPQLHLGDRMLSVAPLRGRRETDDKTGLRLSKHSLE